MGKLDGNFQDTMPGKKAECCPSPMRGAPRLTKGQTVASQHQSQSAFLSSGMPRKCPEIFFF